MLFNPLRNNKENIVIYIKLSKANSIALVFQGKKIVIHVHTRVCSTPHDLNEH